MPQTAPSAIQSLESTTSKNPPSVYLPAQSENSGMSPTIPATTAPLAVPPATTKAFNSATPVILLSSKTWIPILVLTTLAQPANTLMGRFPMSVSGAIRNALPV